MIRTALALGLAGLAACAIAPDVGPRLTGGCDDAAIRPGTVSFRAAIRPLISRMMGGCGCHLPSAGGAGTGTQISGLDLSSFDALREGGLISGEQVVVAGSPCTSILYLKLSLSPPFGSRMPLNGPPYFTDDELRLVHDWIAQGAGDN
ncbi:MAG: hypothetical protein E6J90_24450 [Deltaproteobacteria bacterium]|nr:MAG: hypothetical protein E6J91_53120 [Deltaproteobacteria bacterium]TMQ16086.1 MAG: hypothetical protein E6J90_24450 [Deltaproteobacteria bacterium]